MNKTYKRTISGYLAYLTDVYNGKTNNRDLVVKHGVGTNVQHAVAVAGYADHAGRSLMMKPPTQKDAEKIRVIRREYDLGKHTKRKYVRKAKKIKPIEKKVSKGREISILWGMIKIKS